VDFLGWLAKSTSIDTVASDSHSDTCNWQPPQDAEYDVFECPIKEWAGSTEGYCVLHGNPANGQKLQADVQAAFEKLEASQDEAADLNLQGLDDGSMLDLTNIQIYDSNFQEATLKQATLQTKFSNVDFTGADLSGAVCSGANFRKCSLDETTLRETNFRKGKTTCYETSFVGASCTSTQFEGTTLKKADFTDATLVKAKLAGAECKNADFTRAEISEGVFQGATCSETDFTDATIRRTKFQGADLEKADFSGARILKGQYWGANLQKATFAESVISYANFVRADLQSALFIDAVIGRNTSFREANLKGVNFSTVRLGEEVDFGNRLLQEYQADYHAGHQCVWDHYFDDIHPPTFRTGPTYVLATDGGTTQPTSGEGKRDEQENVHEDDLLLTLTESGEEKELPDCIQSTPPESPLESVHDRHFWLRCSSPWYRYAATITPSLLLTGSEETESLYAESERLYGAIEAGYAGTSSGDKRRRFNIRQNAARQKQLGVGYFRQLLLKRAMLYGESPAQVLRFTGLITVLAAVTWVASGVRIGDQVIGIGYPAYGVFQQVEYWGKLAEHGVRQLIGVSSPAVAPKGVVGQWTETTVAVIGKLLFAMFVYTLGRRATT
jgi:uncharacterized protein YjbI with pentapeptide repeats